MKFLNLLLALLSAIMISATAPAQTIQKNRVIILTDIEAHPDDTQSMVRLLLYANQVDIKGLIATTSAWQKDKKRQAKYGILAVGSGHDTEGSEWIIKVLDEKDPRPLHLSGFIADSATVKANWKNIRKLAALTARLEN